MAENTHILLIDDNYDDRWLITRALHKAGFNNVSEAICGHHGIKQVRAIQPDIILLDLNMPRMSGHEVILELAKGEACAPVVLISTLEEKRGSLNPMGKDTFCQRVKDTIDLVLTAHLEIAYVPHVIQDVQQYAQRPHISAAISY